MNMKQLLTVILMLIAAADAVPMDDRMVQSASLSNITLTTASSDMRYRISGTVAVTRAATTSASVVTTITYTSVDTGTSMTITLGGFNSAGAVATTPANSVTATGILNFMTVISVKSGTNISYS